ncbi:hypothetical protein J2Z37_003141 [Ammoniphilus resinae]|uniref:Uncharacterized protein n=1 Tax=Ammoniphilus resinae TaxID=861532 RepID=A0ABS4GTE4_9BACL|nr:hypothetical protein [Ammoniphilus resinae]
MNFISPMKIDPTHLEGLIELHKPDEDRSHPLGESHRSS